MKPIEKPYFWQFDKGTIPDSLIKDTYELCASKQREQGKVMDGLDKDIRSVERTPIEEFDPISLYLFSLAIKANQALFRYQLGGPSQWEVLHYDKQGDHYDCHIDSVEYDNGFSRKLTVMGYLNEQYEGGKFYFQTLEGVKHYVEVGKGSVLVFPPFVMHGVEPIIEGSRDSVVGWITGPNFK
jgi:PKHD-type hydroxylase